MGLRFRKQVGLFKGVKLNISKKGLSSLSLGKKGASVNLSKKGVRQTIGLPGTGLSYQTDKSTGGFWFIVIFVAICLILFLTKA